MEMQLLTMLPTASIFLYRFLTQDEVHIQNDAVFKVYKQQLFKVGWVGVRNAGSQHKSLIISATAVILFFSPQ